MIALERPTLTVATLLGAAVFLFTLARLLNPEEKP